MHLELSKEILHTRGGVLDAILDNSFDQALIIDQQKKVLFFSKSSEICSGLAAKDALGKSIDDLIANHRFDSILSTGIADKGSLLVINDKISVANHIPVKENGEIIGAIGIIYFSNLSTIKKLFTELSNLHIKEYETFYDSLSKQCNPHTFDDFIGESDSVKKLKENLKSASTSIYPILLIGETGTGKEVLANAIHSENRRTFLQPFVKINCSSIPNNLLEAELFGYEKGAFTGASNHKLGKFEIANNGSILLDEIGEMDILLQSKILRILEEKEFERIGSNNLIPTNARIIASTNANLSQLCREKRFRKDLYYRGARPPT
jgi:transcriptional regulator with PAS, ATPase and Fis domain